MRSMEMSQSLSVEFEFQIWLLIKNLCSWKAGINFPRASERSQTQLDWYLRQIKVEK